MLIGNYNGNGNVIMVASWDGSHSIYTGHHASLVFTSVQVGSVEQQMDCAGPPFLHQAMCQWVILEPLNEIGKNAPLYFLMQLILLSKGFL